MVKYIVLFGFLFFTESSCSMEANCEKINKPIHGLVLKAELPHNRELHFVPTTHTMPLDKFTEAFQNEIFQKSGVFMEQVDDQVTDSFAEMLEFLLPEFIESKGCYQQESDPSWSFKEYPKIEEWYSKTISESIDYIKNYYQPDIDLTHLLCPYNMKPAYALFICHRLDEWSLCFKRGLEKNPEEVTELDQPGMDQDILSKFVKDNKFSAGVERDNDVTNSIPFSSLRFDDIRDDLIEFDENNDYANTLEKLHEDYLSIKTTKSMLPYDSIVIRNKAWFIQYPNLVETYGECVAVHGSAHFAGPGGLINLGQEAGWKWSVYKEDGSYLLFTYDWQALSPFHY